MWSITKQLLTHTITNYSRRVNTAAVYRSAAHNSYQHSRKMTTNSQNNDGGSALTIIPSSSSSSSSTSSARAISSYIPFIPTNEWQVVESNHLLPPGLWIQMDFETGIQKARLQHTGPMVQMETKQTQSDETNEKKEKEEISDKKEVEQSAQKNDEQTQQATDASSASATLASSSSSSSSLPSPLSSHHRSHQPVPSTRQLHNGAPHQPHNLSGTHNNLPRAPTVYPTFPPPSQAFLDARAMLPSPPTPLISIAPMVDVTDRHFRYLIRLLSKHTVLYTPMIVSNALNRAPQAHKLYVEHDVCEHPLVAQLGGADEKSLIDAALVLQSQGFQQINLNVGCPAPSAAGHDYGCILMTSPTFPHTVAALRKALSIPVTIKCRIGVNKNDSWEFFENFIRQCIEIGGINHFIIHARKALLNLRTQKNLTVPELKYDFVYRLKKEYPQLNVEINGGFEDWNKVKEQIDVHGLQGVMLGRHAWKSPYSFAAVDPLFYGEHTEQSKRSRKEVMKLYEEYCVQQWENNQEEVKEFAKKKKKMEEAEERERIDAINKEIEGVKLQSDSSSSSPSSSAAAASSSSSLYPPSSLLVPPPHLDLRTLLRPASYLYCGEPGYKRFRLVWEEELLSVLANFKEQGSIHMHSDRIRELWHKSMETVEPPPARDWGNKDPGYAVSEKQKQEEAMRKRGNLQQHEQQQEETKQNETNNSSSSSSQ